MGLIVKSLAFYGTKGTGKCEVLLDTGASTSFIRQDVAERLGEVRPTPVPLRFRLGNNTVMEADKTVDLMVEINGHKVWHYFLAVPELPYEVILGADFFQKWKIKLDPATEEFIIDEKALEILLA